jgi:hypothetical protein
VSLFMGGCLCRFTGFALIFVTKSKDTDEAGKRHFFR